MNITRPLVLLATALALSACNWFDDSSDAPVREQEFETATGPSPVYLYAQGITPIRFELQKSGTYEIRVTGEMGCQTAPTAFTIATPASNSAGKVSESSTNYELANCVPAAIEQLDTQVVSGPGPWFIDVQVMPKQPISNPGIEIHDLQLGVRRISD